jgi:hypothetical protein
MDYESAFKLAALSVGGLIGFIVKGHSDRLKAIESDVKGQGTTFSDLRVAIAELAGEVRGLRKQLSKDRDDAE